MTCDAGFLEPTGKVIPIQGLKISRAIALVEVLARGKMAFARLIECRAFQDTVNQETVVFEVEVERPQIRINDIRRVERIAATFRGDDSYYPEVVSLRSDFPQVPHLNQRDQEFPRSLCLYDEPWHDLKLTWTAPAFVERVRWWLSFTARGSLHGEDQPLEPIISGSGYSIVIPHAIFEKEDSLPQMLNLCLIGGIDGRVFVSFRPEDQPARGEGFLHLATVLRCDPQQHGIIRRTPLNLKQLNELTTAAGLDVIAALRDRLFEWKQEKLLSARLILILLLPKTREPGGAVENTEVKCFLASLTLLEVGVEIGRWAVHDGQCTHLIVPDDQKDGSGVPLVVLNPLRSFNWELAASLNGLSKRDSRRIVAVGAGALGSQVILNLARAGYGAWVFVDEDFLFPHNLARHALDGFALGHAKAEALAAIVNRLADDQEIATFLRTNILAPGDREEDVEKALQNADVVLDMAASVSVSRHLALHPSAARRVSVFLNPSGTDLIMLLEDSSRNMRLDCLEMQYYRFLYKDNRLHDHLTRSNHRVRYGQSCRDLSSRTPQDLVALHSGIGARALKAELARSSAVIRIWKADPNELGVQVISQPAHLPRLQHHSEWTLAIDDWLLLEISRLRDEKLPNETGGVLIGAYDMHQRIVYVVDVLPAPTDSIEWPTLFKRGYEELMTQVETIRSLTGDNLEYVGEWHSHPNACPTYPSADDLTVFAWIAEEMDIEGKPPLMIIAGEGNTCRAFLSKICKENSEVLCPS